jgi:hypothetical protein
MWVVVAEQLSLFTFTLMYIRGPSATLEDDKAGKGIAVWWFAIAILPCGYA